MVKKKRYSRLAVAGFVLSLLFFIPFAPVLGLIFGIVSLVYISKNKNLNGKGLAIVAIILSALFLILQIYVVVFFYGIFNVVDLATGGDVETAKEKCLAKSGLDKELCVFFLVTVNANNTAVFEENFCDDNMEYEDLRNSCNAILKGDADYCAKIENSQNRLDCFGLVEEIKRNS